MNEMTSSLPFRRAALATVLASAMLPLAACGGGGGEVSVSGGGSLGGASLSGSGTFRPGHQGNQSNQNSQNGQGAQGSQNAQTAQGGQSNQNPQNGQGAHGSQNAQGDQGGQASPGNQVAQNEQAGGTGAADSNGTGRQGAPVRPGTDAVNRAQIDEVLAWLSRPHPEITPSIGYLLQFLDEGPDFRALTGAGGKAQQPEDVLSGEALAYYRNRVETLKSGAVLNLDTEQRVLPKWSLTDEEVALATAPSAYAQMTGRCGNVSQNLEGFNRCMVGTYSGHTEQGESCSVNVGADGKVTFTLSGRQFPSFDIRHRAAFVERNASGDVTSAAGIAFSGWLSGAQVDATGTDPSHTQWFGFYLENYKGKPLVDVDFGNADPEHGPLVDETCYLGR